MKINPQDYIGKAIFITATNTNVGKTFASEVFLKYFAKNGLKVGYFKPIETGVIDNSPLDGLKMFELVKKLNPNFLKLTINDIVPYQFTLPASPYVAKGNTFLDIDFLIEKKDILSDIEFLRNFESYVYLLKHHNVKEEKCFFRVCELCLSQAELDYIYAKWDTWSL